MLYDVRTYTCRPGTLKKHLALYAEHGFAIQKRHLGTPLAYMQTETGDVNSYMHIWVVCRCRRPRGQAWRHAERPGLDRLRRQERGGWLPDEPDQHLDDRRAVLSAGVAHAGGIRRASRLGARKSHLLGENPYLHTYATPRQ